MFSTWFSNVWGFTAALLITSSCCVLFSNGLIVGYQIGELLTPTVYLTPNILHNSSEWNHTFVYILFWQFSVVSVIQFEFVLHLDGNFADHRLVTPLSLVIKSRYKHVSSISITLCSSPCFSLTLYISARIPPLPSAQKPNDCILATNHSIWPHSCWQTLYVDSEMWEFFSFFFNSDELFSTTISCLLYRLS